MWNAAHDTYLEEKILSADPVELVCMLYQGAIDAVEEARRYLAAGEIAARSRAISKACDIVLELSSALDIQLGGQLSLRLADSTITCCAASWKLTSRLATVCWRRRRDCFRP